MTNLKYRIGIDESVKLLNIAKSNGIKIIFDQYRCFYHNVELWYVWLWNYGITKITVVMNMDNVEKNDLCIVIGHLFQKCPAKKYIVIQTEDILQKKYIFEKLCKKSTAIWDYSDNNIKYIEQHYGIKNSVLIPITLSDNNKLYKNIMFNTDFNSRDIDIIIPLHQKRRTILKKQLTSMGLSCVSVWRDKLPKMVNKCKIFLNVHRDSPIASLEIHRIMDVRNVPIVLISEDSLDKDFQKKLDKVPFVNYDDICKLCYEICTNAVVWQKYVNEQIEMWKKFDSEISLQNMLEVTLK